MSQEDDKLLYLVDEETQEFLEATLNIVTGVAELQYDDTAKAGLYSIVETLAERFGIEIAYLNVTLDENGELTADVESPNLAETFPEDPDGTVH